MRYRAHYFMLETEPLKLLYYDIKPPSILIRRQYFSIIFWGVNAIFVRLVNELLRLVVESA